MDGHDLHQREDQFNFFVKRVGEYATQQINYKGVYLHLSQECENVRLLVNCQKEWAPMKRYPAPHP